MDYVIVLYLTSMAILIGLALFIYGLCCNKNRVYSISGISISIIAIIMYKVILSLL